MKSPAPKNLAVCAPTAIAVWVVATLFAMLAGAKLGILKPISELAPQYSFQHLIEKLNSGEIAEGASAVGTLSKQFDYSSKSDSFGNEFEVHTYMDSKQLLKIYVHNAKFYAASLTQRKSRPFGEVWFFCDSELMAQHVKLFSRRSEFDTPTKAHRKQ